MANGFSLGAICSSFYVVAGLFSHPVRGSTAWRWPEQLETPFRCHWAVARVGMSSSPAAAVGCSQVVQEIDSPHHGWHPEPSSAVVPCRCAYRQFKTKGDCFAYTFLAGLCKVWGKAHAIILPRFMGTPPRCLPKCFPYSHTWARRYYCWLREAIAYIAVAPSGSDSRGRRLVPGCLGSEVADGVPTSGTHTASRRRSGCFARRRVYRWSSLNIIEAWPVLSQAGLSLSCSHTNSACCCTAIPAWVHGYLHISSFIVGWHQITIWSGNYLISFCQPVGKLHCTTWSGNRLLYESYYNEL